jgi:hypothetical protein
MENYEYLSHEFSDHAIPATLNVRILRPIVAILHDAEFICNTIGLKLYLYFAQKALKISSGLGYVSNISISRSVPSLYV